ncbi:MAG: HesA/MoeB/ThiF family protein [Nanoarchaeota archaeon]
MIFGRSTKENRYARQDILEFIASTGQKRLGKSRAAVIGLGATGTIAAELLCRAGVGQLILVDRDVVELDNLQRQLLYREKDIGHAKAEIAKMRLEKINSTIKVYSHIIDLNHKNAETILKKMDVVLDCTDNLETRFLINDVCRTRKIRWVHSQAVKDIGSVIVFQHEKTSPCFQCIYENKESELSCETHGVLNTLTAVVGALQAQEAIKILLNKEPARDLIRVSMMEPALEHIGIKKREGCPVCTAKKFDYLSGEKMQKAAKLCGSSSVQILGKEKSLKKVKEKLEKLGKVEDYGYCIRFSEITLFNDGRALIKAKSIEEARILYTKYIGN